MVSHTPVAKSGPKAWIVFGILCCFPTVTIATEPLRARLTEPDEVLDRCDADQGILLAGNEVLSAEGAMSEPTTDQLIQQRLANLEAQLNGLQQNLEFGTLTPGRLRSTDMPPVTTKSSAPTYPNARLTGFFQLDAGTFTQSGGNQTQFGTVPNDMGFRRARLAAAGDVARNVSYMLELDFATAGRPSFVDVWLDVHEIPLFGNIRVGQWRHPFGMENLTSARELTFLERPTGFALAPFREPGIGFHNLNQSQTITWAGSVYSAVADAWGNTYGNKGMGTAFRLTALPVYKSEGRRLLHLGFDHSFQVPGNAGWTYRSRAEYNGPAGKSMSQSSPGGANGGGSGGDVPFFFNTGPLFFDQANLVNFELAGVYDSLHWQTELTWNFVDFGGTTVTIPAAYAQAGYFLTGEVRPYKKMAGVLSRIKPLRPFGHEGGLGAWEVAVRYSYINTNPIVPFQPAAPAAPQTGVAPIPWGGALNDVTCGLNWYLNSYTKLQLNYIVSNINRGGTSSSLSTIAARAQLDF
ncbi:MAG: porin [Planctomycetes bacterium]|nr:porin [Planctomycetota bacterium]